MSPTKKTINGWTLPLFFLLFFGLTSCQSTESFYRGYTVENESLSPLGNQQGSWKTFDLELTYQYQQTDNILDITGSAALSLYYELNTSRIRTLDVYLFLLDDESKVLETVYLTRRLEFSPEENLTFTKTLKIPPGTTSIAFGYKGTALGDGGGDDFSSGAFGGGQEIFYDLPTRPR